MNRKIAFRAWDKQDQKMYQKQAVDEDGYAVDINGDEAYTNQPFRILMQFTGFHDKNGKEIYEGDIVKQWTTDSEDEGETVIGVVEYSPPAFWIKYKEKAFTSLVNYGTNIEVIGDIYENPELLIKD